MGFYTSYIFILKKINIFLNFKYIIIFLLLNHEIAGKLI